MREFLKLNSSQVQNHGVQCANFSTHIAHTHAYIRTHSCDAISEPRHMLKEKEEGEEEEK